MSPRGASPVFVGRHAETGRLSALARQAAAGRGAAVLVEGEPGIGKTTLLDEASAECAQLGMRVLRGAAENLERHLPFAAVGTWLRDTGTDDPRVAKVAALLRGEGAFGLSVAAANHEFAATEAILDLVDQWCAAGPVALIIDDVQWADPSSVVVLHRLGQAIAQQPLLLVVAARSMARGEALAGLVRSLQARDAELLTLAPLPGPAVAAVVENILAAPAGPRLLALVARAGGNPMYVTELVAALAQEGTIRNLDGMAEVTGPPALPKSLGEAILRRLDFLPRAARETLQMAAVLDASVDVAELATVLDLSVMTLSDVVSQAMAAGLLDDRGHALVFRHDLIREVLAEHLPVTVRTALHLRAGQTLASAGAPVERVAEHLLAGTELHQGTIDWLVRNAEALTVRAPRLAVRLLHRAIGMAQGDTGGVLLFNLVRALLWEGSQAEAEQAARAALAMDHDPAREFALRWMLLQACYRQGRLADAVAVADDAVVALRLSPGEVGRFRGFAAICLFYLERFEAGETAAREAVAAGDPVATGLGYLGLAALRFAQGDMKEALALNERSMDAFGRGIQPDLQADPYTMRGYCLLELDRFTEADEAIATALQQNQETGGVYLALTYALRSRLRLLDGRWDDALAEIHAGLDVPDPLGQTPGLRAMAALIAIHRGSYRDDEAEIPEPDDSVGGRKYGYLTRWVQALLAETRAEPERALDLLYPVWEHAWGLDHRRVIYRICSDLARLAAAVGDQKRAQDLASTTETLALQQPTHSLRATARLCRGLAEDDPDALLAAARAFHQAGWPLYEGHGYENAAAALARAGRDREARDALGTALGLYAGLDAVWDIARAESRLRQEGIRRGRYGPRKRPKHGWEALTDTETKVALLVAEGLSNPDVAARMYLSRRTVQTHVSSILAKLDLTSRVELALAVSRREPR